MSSNIRVLRTEIITNCKVCNETINAYLSYGALACPSCRVFFRRQTSTQQLSLNFCLSNGTCKITKETRTNCQYCRYQKCLNIGMDPERIHQGKNGRKNRFYGKYIKKYTSSEVIDLSVQIQRPFLHVSNLGNVESFMPFTMEELGFCVDLRKSKINAWKSHPAPMELFDTIISKQKMDDPQDMRLQKTSDNGLERFVALINSLDLFKSMDVKDQFLLLSSNLHFSLILFSANLFHPKYSAREQVNLYLHGDPDFSSENSDILQTEFIYPRFEIEELMPWCTGSHPMHQVVKMVMQIDMDETIFMLLSCWTFLNSKEIKMMRIQEHLKLTLFRYLKYKSCQSEALLKFQKIEEVICKLLNSKNFFTLLQE